MRTPARSRYCPEPSDRENAFTGRQHGSFGGPSLISDAYYGAGSDDFRGYVWKIPETPGLLEQRKEIDADHWSLEDDETIGVLREALMASFGI